MSILGKSADCANTYNSQIQKYKDIKVTIIGESSVGKTSLTKRIAFDKFTFDSISTIGAAYCSFKQKKDGIEFTFKMWDTAGQERYKSLVPMYISGSDIILLVFDITNATSFDKIDSWLEYVSTRSPDASLILIGSKLDMEERRTISSNLAETFSKMKNMEYIECSSKNGTNIDKILKVMLKEALIKNAVEINDIIDLEESIDNTWTTCINKNQCVMF